MELLQDRLNVLDAVSNYVGEYFSREWVMKNVMMMTDEDIQTMKDQVEAENANSDDSEDEETFNKLGEMKCKMKTKYNQMRLRNRNS